MRVPAEARNERPIVAVDPGHTKCGVAVVEPDGSIIARDIVTAAMIGETARVMYDDHAAGVVVVGGGTSSDEVRTSLSLFFDESDIQIVDEENTTLEARSLYREENPPGCLGRLIPVGLLIPPRPLDDYAAAVIGRRYFSIQDAKGRDTPEGDSGDE